jgi:acyl-CoA synthetase (AMP-forming)/AMP-acid ligase II
MITGKPLSAVKFSNLNEMLAAAARTEHGITFVDLQEQESWVSYGEVYQQARRMAHRLIQIGVQPGDRVGIGIPTSPNFATAFFGTLLAGAVPAPLYPSPRVGRLTDYYANITRMLNAVGTRLILADAHTFTVLKPAAEMARPALGCRMLEELLPDTATDEAEVPVEPGMLGLIQFSSGSTNTPKGIALPHRSLVNQTHMMATILTEDGAEGHKIVSWMPLYHDFGLIGCFLTAIYMQVPLIIMSADTFITQPRLWLRAISRHGGTITMAPNFAYELCLRRIPDAELETLRLHTLRHALNGAEPVSASMMEAFSARFARCGLKQQGVLQPVYGLAEATLTVSYPPTPRAPVHSLRVDDSALAQAGCIVPGKRKLASCGGAMPGVSIQIRDEAGTELPDRRVGRIFVKTSSPMQGYFNNPEATAQALFGEWLYTGDLGFIADGELYICGRVKDLVIIRGANHPAELFEESLHRVAGVRPGWAVAAGFIPPNSESEELLILAERNSDSSAEDALVEKEIRKVLLDATGVRAHTIVMLPKGTLRRTSSGKIRRQDALQRFLSGELLQTQPMLRPTGTS